MNTFHQLSEEDERELARYADVFDLEIHPVHTKKRKDFRLEAKRSLPQGGFLGMYWKEWQSHGRYATVAHAKQAANDLAIRSFWSQMHYRIVNTKTKQVIEINLPVVKREFNSANAMASA